MAQDRFYFWRGYYDAMEYLSDEEAGMLFRAICAYAFDGEEPDFTDNRLMQVAWTMVADNVAESVDMGRRSSKGGVKSGETRRVNATKKPARKRRHKGGSEGGSEAPSEGGSEVSSNVRYGNVLSPSTTEREFATLTGASAPAADAAARAPVMTGGVVLDVPPKPEGA